MFELNDKHPICESESEDDEQFDFHTMQPKINKIQKAKSISKNIANKMD